MALSIGQLVGYVSLDTKGVRKGAAEAEGAMDDLGRKMDNTGRKSGGGLSGFLGKAIKGTALALGGLGIAGGVMGTKTAAGMEQARISFTTMLGSAQKADKFIKQLAAFAAKTPFEFPELQTAASSLIAAGVNANKVIPIMTTLGNVTSGMGTGSEGIKRATVALQQMQAAGKITGEDLNQLRDAGIPVYDLLAKATGKSKAEVVKLAQAGKLGKGALDKMMKTLETGKGLERFNGLMDKQSKSLSGVWSTFTDTINMKLAKALEPLIPLMKDGLGGATKLLSALLPVLADALMRVMNATKSTVEFFQKHKTLAIVLASVIAALTVVTLAHEAAMAVGAAGGMAAWLKQTKLISSATKVWTAIQWLFNAAMSANPISLVIIGLVALGAALFVAYKKSDTARKVIDAAFHGIATAASFMWDKVLKPVFKLWLNTWFTIIGAVLNGAAKAFGWVPGIGGKLKAAASEFNKFRDSVNNALDGIKPQKEIRLKVTTEQIVANPSISKPRVPKLASGGRVTSATVAMIGEGREPESVLPDSVLRGLLERAHAAGAASAQPATASGPMIGQVVTYNTDPNIVAEQLWYKTRTRG